MRLLLLLSVIGATSASAASPPFEPTATATPPLSGHDYYMDALGHYFAKRSKTMLPGKGIVFIGDSITNGLCVESLFGAVNFAISGDTVRGAKERVLNYQHLEDKTVVIELGVNDLPRSVAEIARDYGLLIDRLPKSAHIYISAVLPIDEDVFRTRWNTPKTNQQIDELNEALKLLSTTRPNVSFIDANSHLKDASGGLKKDYHVGDGIHPNDAGYAQWVLGLRETLPKNAIKQTASKP